jgi:[CysO sulfur-carrier protein]-thiocarboxylate-dependent cysteine synthase
MSVVRIPPVLRQATGGEREVTVEGGTVSEVLDALYEAHPAVRTQLQTPEGELHKFVNVYLNDEDVRLLSWLDTEVSDGDTLLILPAMAGGATGLAPPATAVSPDLVATIGETPLVELNRISPSPDVRILAKLESHNPTGSIKDRTALSLIEDAERRGKVKPGDTIMEPTSGNTGISLAMICRVRGYRLVAVMPENVTPERKQLLQLYGAEIVETDGEYGSNGAVEVATRLSAENGLYMPFQYGNPANPRAHYEGTAAEIVRDCPEIDVFVAGLGTGGTLMGSSQRLKEHRPDIRIVACEPLQGDPVSGLRSLDDGFVPPILDLSRLDRKLLVANRDALRMTRRLASEEGIFAGVSSGAVIHTCLRVAQRMESGTIVGIVCDGGWKYLSSGLWSGDEEAVEDTLDRGIFW